MCVLMLGCGLAVLSLGPQPGGLSYEQSCRDHQSSLQILQLPLYFLHCCCCLQVEEVYETG
jgi:hypothetical protein